MILKVGTVYLWNSKHYVFIKDKMVEDDRIVIELSKVNSDGSLGVTTRRKYNPREFSEAPEIKVSFQIHIPKVDADNIQYERLVEEADLILQKTKKGLIDKKQSKKKVAQLIFSAIALYNKKEDRPYNLRDFAKSLEMRKYTKAYNWVTLFIKQRVRDDVYNYHELSDRSVNMIFNNYKKHFKSIYGFNKDLNEVIVASIRSVIQEKKRRAI